MLEPHYAPSLPTSTRTMILKGQEVRRTSAELRKKFMKRRAFSCAVYCAKFIFQLLLACDTRRRRKIAKLKRMQKAREKLGLANVAEDDAGAGTGGGGGGGGTIGGVDLSLLPDDTKAGQQKNGANLLAPAPMASVTAADLGKGKGGKALPGKAVTGSHGGKNTLTSSQQRQQQQQQQQHQPQTKLMAEFEALLAKSTPSKLELMEAAGVRTDDGGFITCKPSWQVGPGKVFFFFLFVMYTLS